MDLKVVNALGREGGKLYKSLDILSFVTRLEDTHFGF